jgi:zinc transport system permease protein
VFTILTAVTVSVAARTVGALIVSPLMVLPVACAMQVAKSYRQTVGFSILFGVFYHRRAVRVYYADLRPGATIVLLGVVVWSCCWWAAG